MPLFIAGFLPWLTAFATWGVFAGALYVFLKVPRERHAGYYWILAGATLGFRASYAGLAGYGQYLIWNADKVTKATFLLPAYFWPYIFSRFWLNFLLTILMAGIFFLLLGALRRYRGRFFEEGEVELGGLLALAVGWPISPVFICLVFITVVLVSLVRRAALREAYTTLGLPFLLAAFACLILGSIILHNIGWDYLKI
jgi:hypothetical protein